MWTALVVLAAGMEPFARNTKHFETDGGIPDSVSMAEGAVKALKNWVVDSLGGQNEGTGRKEHEARESPPTAPPGQHHPAPPAILGDDSKLPTAAPGKHPLVAERSSMEASLEDVHVSQLETESTTEDTAAIQAEVDRLKARNAFLEQGTTDLDKENADLEARVAELEAVKKQRQKNAGSPQSSLADVGEKKTMTAAELGAKLGVDLSAASTAELEEMQHLVERNAFLEAENPRLEKQNKDMEASLADLEKTQGKAEKDAKGASAAELGGGQASEAELAALSQAKARNAELQAKVDAQDKENAMLQQRVDELEELHYMHERNEGLEKEVSQHDQERELLLARIKELESEKEAAKAKPTAAPEAPPQAS